MLKDIIEYLIIIFMICILTIILFKKDLEKNDTRNVVDVIVNNRKIEAGTIVDESFFEYKDFPEEVIPEKYVTTIKELIGKTARITIENNSIIAESFICAEKDIHDTNIVMYSNIIIGDDICKGNIVNIKIKINEQEEYIVLSNKKIAERKDEKIWLNLSLLEQEELLKAIGKIETGCVVYAEKKGDIEN